MKRKWTFLLLVGIVISLASLTWLRKTVTVVIDGQAHRRVTYALRVAGALAGIELHPLDRLDPPRDAWLSENDTIVLEKAAPAQILADGELYDLVSAERRPAILSAAGLSLRAGDKLLSNGRPVPLDQPLPHGQVRSLQIVRQNTFSLSGGEAPQTITHTGNAYQAMWAADISLHAADQLTWTETTPSQIELAWNPSQAITIHTAQKTIDFRSAAPTVGEALAEAGLALQGLDYSQPYAADPLPADGQIRLYRLREEILLEQTLLPFGYETALLDDIELDQSKLVQSGAYGIEAERVRLRYQDGVEISRVSENRWVAQTPQPEVVGYGTKIVQKTLETANGTISYYRSLQFYATAYSPKSQGGSYSTATGEILRKGIVAIDPDYVPYGSRLYIPGYGVGLAADTGHIIGRWIDLGYSDDDKESWSRWTTVYFLWPPPAYVPPFIPAPSHY